MESQSPHPLDYASPRTTSGSRQYFRTVLALLASAGALANVWFVYLAVNALHRAHWAYRDLVQNPRAYFREVAPATIASLRAPYGLWTASAALILSAALGLALALHLLRSIWILEGDPERAWRGIARYRQIKPFGLAATTAAFYAFVSANHAFWVAATRHVPVGSGPPVIESAVLVACALLPWWWIGRVPQRTMPGAASCTQIVERS